MAKQKTKKAAPKKAAKPKQKSKKKDDQPSLTFGEAIRTMLNNKKK